MAAAADLRTIRNSLKLTQTEMGKRLGLSLRAYQDVEASDRPIRDAYLLAAERVSLDIAVERGDPMLAVPPVRDAAFKIVEAMRGE